MFSDFQTFSENGKNYGKKIDGDSGLCFFF